MKLAIALALLVGLVRASVPSGTVWANFAGGDGSSSFAAVDIASGQSKVLVDTSNNMLFNACNGEGVNAHDSKRNIWWSVQCTNSSNNVPSLVGVSLSSGSISQLKLTPAMTENDFSQLFYSAKSDSFIGVFMPNQNYAAISISPVTGVWQSLFNYSANVDNAFAWDDKTLSIYAGIQADPTSSQWMLVQQDLTGKILSSVNVTEPFPASVAPFLLGAASSGILMTIQQASSDYPAGSFQMESYVMPSATPNLSPTVFQWGGSSGEGQQQTPIAFQDSQTSQQGVFVTKASSGSAQSVGLCWIAVSSSGDWSQTFNCATNEIAAVNSIIYVPN